MSVKPASTDFVMNDLNRTEKTLIGSDHDKPNKSAVSILSSTCRLVVGVIPPLLELGLVPQSECIWPGAIIGVASCLTSWNDSAIHRFLSA